MKSRESRELNHESHELSHENLELNLEYLELHCERVEVHQVKVMVRQVRVMVRQVRVKVRQVRVKVRQVRVKVRQAIGAALQHDEAPFQQLRKDNMVAPAVIPVLASIGGALLSLLSPLTGSSKKKDADILHARQELLQFTSNLFEIVRLTNPDSPMLPEMKKLEEAIALLEVAINNKGLRFQEIWNRIAAIRAKLIDFSAEVARQAAGQPARQPDRQSPIMMAVINSAGAIHPMYLEQLDNLLIHFLEHFYDNPRASLVINHAPQPAIAQIYEVDNTPEIVMEAENVESQPVQPTDLPIPGYENLDQIAVQNHRAMVAQFHELLRR
ncbi:hypothetical protein BGZ49_001821 [Haplosporangium sp. Z 27]|nr:hypothetical protein BGZ49_001821 [Haplosporangium sp. Z 27]